jgi:signal transduction histidine kinase
MSSRDDRPDVRSPRLTVLREDLGGPLLLDRGGLIALVPASLLTSVLTRDPSDLRTTLAWLGVNLASIALTWLWIELMRTTIARSRARRPVRLGTVLAIGASIGFVKGVTTSLFAWTARLLPELLPAAEWWRALGTTMQGVLLLPALTLATATLARYRTEYVRLIAERARLALLAGPSDVDADPTRDRLIVGFVTEARRRLTRTEDHGVAAVLEQLVDERLRPIAHALWTPGTLETDFSARSLLRAALLVNPFPTLLVATGYALTVAASRAQNTPVDVNAVRTLASIVTIGVVFAVARRWRSERPRRAVLHLVVTLSTLAALEAFLLEPILTDGSGLRPIALFVSVLVWLTVLTLLGGAVTVAVRDGGRVHAELAHILGRILDEDHQGGVDIERTSRLLRDREVADHLHSSLQNRLTSAARRIAASGESVVVVREELDAIGRLLDDLAAGVPAALTAALAAEQGAGSSPVPNRARAQLRDVIARWAGFVTITEELDARLDSLTPRLQDRIVQVIIEALNNAVRHGRAATVSIRLTASATDGALTLTVDDDGVGPVVRGPGLGSALFTAMSGGDWRLESRPEGGSRLIIMLPVD